MITAIVILLIVAALVALVTGRPSSPFPALADRDRQRQLDELRALPDYRSDAQLR